MGTDHIQDSDSGGCGRTGDTGWISQWFPGKQHCFHLFAIHFALFAVTAMAGCQYFYDSAGEEKMIPGPLPTSFPYEVTGQLYRVWIGNEIQIRSGEYTSYVVLQGVNNPDSGDETEQQAIDHLYALIGGQEIRAVIYERDNMQRGIAQVFVGETNLNLQMLTSGWGQFDGTAFDAAQSFADAQEQARKNKLGIWQVQ